MVFYVIGIILSLCCSDLHVSGNSGQKNVDKRRGYTRY